MTKKTLVTFLLLLICSVNLFSFSSCHGCHKEIQKKSHACCEHSEEKPDSKCHGCEEFLESSDLNQVDRPVLSSAEKEYAVFAEAPKYKLFLRDRPLHWGGITDDVSNLTTSLIAHKIRLNC